MSVTTRIPDLVKSGGGIPTAAELEGLHSQTSTRTCSNRLFRRTSDVLIDAYEAAEKTKLDVDHDLVSGWLYWSENIAYTCEQMLKAARKLETLTKSLCDVAHHGGVLESPPPFGRYGREYEPTQEALEQWGLVTPKADDAS